eukprot:8302388-Alexandrium_andersonii.AAC.1
MTGAVLEVPRGFLSPCSSCSGGSEEAQGMFWRFRGAVLEVPRGSVGRQDNADGASGRGEAEGSWVGTPS